MRCKNCKDKFEPKYFNYKYCDKEDCNNVGVAETLSKARKQLEKKKREVTMRDVEWCCMNVEDAVRSFKESEIESFSIIGQHPVELHMN